MFFMKQIQDIFFAKTNVFIKICGQVFFMKRIVSYVENAFF